MTSFDKRAWVTCGLGVVDKVICRFRVDTDGVGLASQIDAERAPGILDVIAATPRVGCGLFGFHCHARPTTLYPPVHAALADARARDYSPTAGVAMPRVLTGGSHTHVSQLVSPAESVVISLSVTLLRYQTLEQSPLPSCSKPQDPGLSRACVHKVTWIPGLLSFTPSLETDSVTRRPHI